MVVGAVAAAGVAIAGLAPQNPHPPLITLLQKAGGEIVCEVCFVSSLLRSPILKPRSVRWKIFNSNPACSCKVVTTYETAYGTIATIFVLPSGVALAVAWNGDNTGPGPAADNEMNYRKLRSIYPNATVLSSTFDAFFAAANVPEVKAKLPVVTAEIGDGWIYGVSSQNTI